MKLIDGIKEANFLGWFDVSGGKLDPRCHLTSIEGMGRGMLAEADIKEGEVLFVIPRKSLLNLQTTGLTDVIRNIGGKQAMKSWSKLQNEGWVPLIVAMLWEDYHSSMPLDRLQGSLETWGPYFDLMPKVFFTPMFWPQEDLDHLKGTSIEDKLGKEDAEATYYEKVLPFVQSFPKVFGGVENNAREIRDYFSLERYHMMASRILSRSFHVKRQLNVAGRATHHNNDKKEDEEDEEEHEDVRDISMVPMADMLNARSNSDNARLFYYKRIIKMRATKDISAGEQIFNTYADPPNSDLLRRYGHVDEPNEHDIVELDASLICHDEERLQWACETFDIDEVFSMSLPFEVDDGMIVLAKIALMSQEQYTKAVEQEKCPSPRLDPATTGEAVCQMIIEGITERLKQYPDLKATNDNQRRAEVVRLGEKNILEQYKTGFQELLVRLKDERKPSQPVAKKQKR